MAAMTVGELINTLQKWSWDAKVAIVDDGVVFDIACVHDDLNLRGDVAVIETGSVYEDSGS